MTQELERLHSAMLALGGFLNRPQPDAALIAQAGVQLERALFPLMMRLALDGPLPVGELADLAGRDYTTVSRQVSRLQALGLVRRQARDGDARVREIVLTPDGKAMGRALDRARRRLMRQWLAGWSANDIATLARLMQRLAGDARTALPGLSATR